MTELIKKEYIEGIDAFESNLVKVGLRQEDEDGDEVAR